MEKLEIGDEDLGFLHLVDKQNVLFVLQIDVQQQK
jgi:hypothetical protein